MGHQGVTLVAVQTEGGVHGEVAAGRYADLQASPRHDIEHRRIFGHPDRQLQRQGDDGGPQPDARGPRGDLRQEDQGRRHATLGFMEMCRATRLHRSPTLRMGYLSRCPAYLGWGRLIDKRVRIPPL